MVPASRVGSRQCCSVRFLRLCVGAEDGVDAGLVAALLAELAESVGVGVRGQGARDARLEALLPSLRDLVPFLLAYPGLTSGAEICRPSGAGV